MSRPSSQPIMRLLEVLGRRWTLRVLWELQRGPLTFRALQDASGGVSPSVLNQRLGELRDAGVVALTADGYALSREGQELGELLLPLDGWARRWARRRRGSKAR